MERLALDTRYWQTPKQAEENLAGILIEQKKGPLTKRINYVELAVDENGEFSHPDFGEVKAGMVIESEIDEMELKALNKLNQWAKRNEEGFAIWISPPHPKQPGQEQEEARFIVYELVNKDEEKKVSLHALCGYQTTSDCLAIAEQIAPFSPDEVGVINSEEALRETPIPFLPPDNMNFPDFLQQFIKPPEIWEVIRKGQHIKEKEKTLKESKPIVKYFFPQINTAHSYQEHLIISAQIEQLAKARGYQIQEVGPCGMSPSAALALLGINTGPFGLLHSGLATVEASFPCPRCHKPIPSGQGITTCPHCGARKEDYQTCI